MKVLVTGCAGFIGWKVSELLLEEGHTVVGVDNVNNTYDVRLKQWRLSQLECCPNFNFHLVDITSGQQLQQLFEHSNIRTSGQFEAVVNLAARAGIRQSLEDPWAYYETNVGGTLKLLELCKEYGISKFVLASTSSLYGDVASSVPGNQPGIPPRCEGDNAKPGEVASKSTGQQFREDMPTDRPLSPYAASKKAAEGLCYTYHYLYGLDVSVVRYFTVYGAAGRPDMSIFRFIKWITEREPVVLYGDGSQMRDFTCVDDIARGTLAALRPLGFEVINLGGDRPVSLKTVINLLEEQVGQLAQVERQPAHPADVPATWAEISKARRLLGWTPKITLETGLQQTVDWYKQNRSWAKEVRLS